MDQTQSNFYNIPNIHYTEHSIYQIFNTRNIQYTKFLKEKNKLDVFTQNLRRGL